MGRRCFVKKCDTSSDIIKSRDVSLFAVPKREDIRKKWIEVVPQKKRKLNSKDYICEKHFSSEHVIVMHNFFAEFTCKKLKPEAVPDRFARDKSGNFYNEDILSTDKKPVVIECHPEESDTSSECDPPYEHFIEYDYNKPLRGATATPEEDPLKESKDSLTKLSIFKILSENKPIVSLRGESWDMMVKYEPDNLVIFHKLLKRLDYKKATDVVSIQVMIGKDLDFIILFGHENVTPLVPKTLQTVTDVENLLQAVDKLDLCPGGPILAYYKRRNLTCAEVHGNRWRHFQCEKLSYMGKACSKCDSLY